MQRRDFLPAMLLAAAACAVYLNSFSVPFLFDDFYHILWNNRIRDLLHPVPLLAETTRPLTALTLAVNYALGGLNVWGYHAFNLAVHVAAGLTLFGVIRRTLLSPRLRSFGSGPATEWAFAASLIWLVHPLQTESVTYIVQRGESLMGLFYLLTLYCVIRGWPGRAVLCCALGMLAKPVMVTAPAVVLLYDRIFLASSWKELFRRRGRLYAGLAATWMILPLVLAGGTREYRNLVGMNLPQASPPVYLLTQAGVVLHYLRLCFWPDPLILDYEWPLSRTFSEAAPAFIAVAGLLVLTLWALRRKPEIGFLGAWFFGILAPTSSFLPIVDPAFEHRMYLPLAAVVLLFLIALKRLTGSRRWLFRSLFLILAALLSAATYQRNELYRHPVEFWRQNIAHRPGGVRARISLGAALLAEDRQADAFEVFQETLAIQPDCSDAHNNLACLLFQQGRLEESYLHYREALRLSPHAVMAHKGIGMALQKMGRLEEAAAEYEETLRLNPVFSDTRVQLGLIRQIQGRGPEALRQYKEALRLDPRDPDAWNNIGTLLFQEQKWEKAAPFFRKALELKPNYPEARENLRKTLENISGGP